MKRGRRSADDRATARLLDLWQRRPEFGEPVGCVATTYTFDPAHFEEHCLARFVGIEGDPAEDVTAYVLEREERLSEVFAAVLVDQAHVSGQRSLRWNLLPVRVEDGGCLHAKVALLVWADRVRVVISSANLTEPGYRRNLENAAHLDFTRDGDAPLALLYDVLGLIEDVRRRALGYELADGPQPALARFLSGVRQQVQGWAKAEPGRRDPTAHLVVTAPDRRHLFAQLAELWGAAPARDAWVVSPFFDDGDGALETVHGLETLLAQRGERTIHIVTSGQRLPDGIVQLDLPACLEDASTVKAELRYRMVTTDPEVGFRPLHAKSIWIERDGRAMFCVGSSNFTRAGTALRERGPINVEANLAFTIPDLAAEFGRICDRAYPESEEIDPSEEDVRFLAPGERTPEPEGYLPLPPAYGAALYRHKDGAGELLLELLATPPSGATIRAESGASIALGDAPGLHVVEWHDRRPPSHLTVEWHGDGVGRAAIWPVNVTDTSVLPPPEELRSLSLEELIEVLVSTRPIHVTVGRILDRRRAAARVSHRETDPHKRVKTSHFLLKRMRRLSAAFEELRERLERPMHSREALTWRLRGPLGPLALAARIVADEPQAAGFILAELAETLRELQLQPRGELSASEIEVAVADVIGEVRQAALRHPAPPNLAKYVEKIFAEVAR